MNYYKYTNADDEAIANGKTRCICGIKPDNYYSGLDQIAAMVEIAKADFPGLTDEYIHVVAYDGDLWKRIVGIEFRVDVSGVPMSYVRVYRLESVFAGKGR